MKSLALRSSMTPSFDRAYEALQKAQTVGEVKNVRDQAEAIRVYVRQQGMSLEMQNRAAELKLRAERKAGELLAADPLLGRGKSDRLSGFGIGWHQSSRWQRIAGMPEDRFEGLIAEAQVEKRELTEAWLLRSARELLEERRDNELPSRARMVDQLEKLATRHERFGTIYADPPWRYGNQATRAATDRHYPTLSVEDIASLPIADLVANEAHLHLWTTNAFLFEASKVIEAWGFSYKSCFVWVKPQMGIGNYWRVSHEFLLLGVRGACSFRNRGLKSWSEEERGQHSRKPEAVRRMVEKASPAPRLELFGRRVVDGWTVWGNEVTRAVYDPDLEELAV